MKLPKAILPLLLSIGSLHAAPILHVHWTFDKEMSLKLPFADQKDRSFAPARVLDLSFPLGRSDTATQMKDVPFPTGYSRPSGPSRGSIVTPATPSQFDSESLGYKLVLEGSQEGPYIRLLGTLLMRISSNEQSVFGEESGPIYFDTDTKGLLLIGQHGDKVNESLMRKTGRPLGSPNTANMARLKTAESHFQVNAKPGKTYALTLTGPEGPVRATVSCTVEP
ncbi:hypothetical protein BH09VER1_BH09VER1_26080 [soil metagenome]